MISNAKARLFELSAVRKIGRRTLNLSGFGATNRRIETAQAAIDRGSAMTKQGYGSISAMALAALLVGGMTLLPNFSQVVASAPIHSGKGDRLDYRPLGTQCSEQAWPNFEAGCLRDKRDTMGKAKQARIVTADRLAH
jgi:hypothetical protein